MSEFSDTFEKALRSTMQTRTGFQGFEFISSEVRSRQRLYEFPASRPVCHQDRVVDDTGYSLTVYVAAGGKRGVASLTIVPFEDPLRQIKSALAMAGTSLNQTWPLAEPPREPYPVVDTCDSLVREDPDAVIQGIEDDLAREAGNHPDVRLNSAEIYVNCRSVRRVTGTGIRTLKNSSDMYVEAAMERAGTANDKEVHEFMTGVSVDDMDMASFLGRCAAQVAGLGHTEPPAGADRITIMVDAYVISRLLAAVRSHCSVSRGYFKYPYFKKGDMVFGGEKHPGSDALSMTLDPFIPRMAESSGHTPDGLVSVKGPLISNDMLQTGLVDQRFGSYQNLAPNGLMGNMVVPPGAVPAADFARLAPDRLEVIVFSSLLINTDTLTWSSEIKLARRHRADGTFGLIKGGVASGSLKENLADFVFSRETERVNFPGDSYHGSLGYSGPARMLIRAGVSVAGPAAPEGAGT